MRLPFRKTSVRKPDPDIRRAGVERLENRRLFAVSVVQTYPGYYEVDPDSASNNIHIKVSQGDDTFTLNGVTYPNVAFITVNGNGRDDQISVVSDNELGPIGCAVNGGGGNDSILVSGLTGAIHGGGGNDTLVLKDSFYGEVYGDTGSCNIFVIGDCQGAEVVGGTGNNTIDASESNYGVTLMGGPGNDTIYGSAYDDVIYGGGGNDVLYGNGGNDTFYSNGGLIIGASDGGINTAYIPTGANVTCINVQYIFNT
jgi:Ca2+-binding RTX toxin-like protein